MKCPRCGSELPRHARECAGCGFQVKSTTASLRFQSGGSDAKKTALYAGLAAVLMIVALVCVVQEIGRIKQKQEITASYLEAETCYNNGDYENAAAKLNALKSKAPKEGNVYLLLGKAYEAMGMTDQALVAYDEGLDHCSQKDDQTELQNAKIGVLVSMINQALDDGRVDYARELAQTVIELDPTNSVALQALDAGGTELVEDEVEEEAEEPIDSEEIITGASGLDAIPMSTINVLPESIDGGTWDVNRKVQGVEWNTDTMDTFYVSYASYIVAYHRDGTYQTASNDIHDAYLFSIDYYDGKVFSVMRSSSYGKFKLRVYDADTLELLNSTDLKDIHSAYSRDKKKSGTELIPSIDGITVAPAIGRQDRMKIYVSYNAYYSEEDGITFNEQQSIYEYDYDEAVNNPDAIEATRVFQLNLDGAEYGIQTLEYDRSTGNIWCAIRQGYSDYSLYCIDAHTSGNHLKLLSNGGEEGWDCPHAGDGLCSLGNDCFYVLIPTYYDDAVSTEIRRVSLDELEEID